MGRWLRPSAPGLGARVSPPDPAAATAVRRKRRLGPRVAGVSPSAGSREPGAQSPPSLQRRPLPCAAGASPCPPQPPGGERAHGNCTQGCMPGAPGHACARRWWSGISQQPTLSAEHPVPLPGHPDGNGLWLRFQFQVLPREGLSAPGGLPAAGPAAGFRPGHRQVPAAASRAILCLLHAPRSQRLGQAGTWSVPRPGANGLSHCPFTPRPGGCAGTSRRRLPPASPTDDPEDRPGLGSSRHRGASAGLCVAVCRPEARSACPAWLEGCLSRLSHTPSPGNVPLSSAGIFR